jgi:hypothetical protein
MTSSSNDTDREALHSLLCSVFPFTESDIADRILAEFLPDHDERVKAEALRDAADAWDREFARGKVLTPFAASWLRDRAESRRES